LDTHLNNIGTRRSASLDSDALRVLAADYSLDVNYGVTSHT